MDEQLWIRVMVRVMVRTLWVRVMVRAMVMVRVRAHRDAWMSSSAARPREDDSCLVSPIAPASAVAPCLVMPATSCPARVRDEDQLAVGALLPAVHGRFTSSRSYRSPDRSSSYRVALIIWRAALPLRRRVSTVDEARPPRRETATVNSCQHSARAEQAIFTPSTCCHDDLGHELKVIANAARRADRCGTC